MEKDNGFIHAATEKDYGVIQRPDDKDLLPPRASDGGSMI
jgi:hypothetical protein